ncbi:MAG: sugar ABC transporter ATP-binding protein [Pirellulaceae bacterium]|nr:sugar ABC transporter ATP-binding protein [Planctomycetales bacterium]
MNPDVPLLEMVGVSKAFGPTQALSDVSLSVVAGKVLALVGENGAGKSTLLKILSGAHHADRGEMRIAGHLFRPANPHDARAAGVAMIYQELNLAPDLTVEDNILLGQAGTGWGTLLRGRLRPRVLDALQTVGLGELSPKAIVGALSVAQQQLIEIARALASNAKIILFDEPTSSLPKHDVERLFEIIRRLRETGIGVVYISHFLEEVRDICDTYTVLRDGHNAGGGVIDEVTDAQIVACMVGRDVADLFPKVPHTPGEPWVRVEDLSGQSSPLEVTVQLRRGEIFGVAGLVGAGRTELLRCIVGLDYCRTGVVYVDGQAAGHSLRARMTRGIGLVSEDRKSEGLAQELSIIDNMTLSNLAPYTKLGLLDLKKRGKAVAELMARLEVKARHGHQAISDLSGGNQQKVAIARILHQNADILLLDEPTKGIDVGTKAEIYRLMGELAAQGKTIVFVSSYLPELLAVCDRIGVMARGRLRDVRETSQWTEESVMECAIEIDGGGIDA